MSSPRILIVRLGALGDIIHALPAVASLRNAFPDSHIGWVVERRWVDLLRAQPNAAPRSPEQPLVDSIHVVDTRRWRSSLTSHWTRKDVYEAIRDLRAAKYNVTVDLQGAIKSALISVISGADRRYGYADPWEHEASLFYGMKIPTASAHVVEQALDLARAVETRELHHSFETSAPRFVLPLHPETEHWADTRLAPDPNSRGFVVLNPGAGWGAKQWPAECYAEVARALGAAGLRCLVNHGPGEEELAQRVERESHGTAIATSYTVGQLIAVLRRARLFIGGDTGPLHLAAALGVPVVAIFGPTDPARNGPYTTNKVVLRSRASQTSHARTREPEQGLLSIPAGAVIHAANKLLVGAA